MATAHLNGIDVYFERSGSGPRVLFCNGSGATLAGTSLLLQPFTERVDLVAHDQRGLGRTSIPPGPSAMADYAADAIALMDHVGWDTCRVAGISFGGMVAQELAVTVPDRVEKLALLCTSPGGPDLASYPLHELADMPPDEVAALRPLLLDTRFTPEWLAEHPKDKGLADMMAARTAGDAPAEQRRGELEQLHARRDHDVLDRLGRITCPTLVAAGRYDGIAPLVNSEAIAAAIPDAELRVFEGGHAFFVQDRDAFPTVINFLAG